MKLVVTARIRAGIAAFVAEANSIGWTITPASQDGDGPDWAGPPWSATVAMRDIAIEHAAGSARLRWTAPRLDASISAFAPGILTLSVGGEQTAAFGSAAPRAFRTRSAALHVPLRGRDPATLTPATLTIDALDAAGFRLEHLSALIGPMSVDVSAEATPLFAELPPAFAHPIMLSARLTASQALPTDSASAKAWQASGGTVAAEALSLDWGPLRAIGHGTLSLDPQLQPEAQASLVVRGAGDALDAAARAGLIGSSPANAARAVIGLLSMASPGSSFDRAATLPMALTRRTLSVAQFPVARIPVLQWDSP